MLASKREEVNERLSGEDSCLSGEMRGVLLSGQLKNIESVTPSYCGPPAV